MCVVVLCRRNCLGDSCIKIVCFSDSFFLNWSLIEVEKMVFMIIY